MNEKMFLGALLKLGTGLALLGTADFYQMEF